jgi:hypothetical protein
MFSPGVTVKGGDLHMKKLAVVLTALLVLMIGVGVPAWAASNFVNTSTVGSAKSLGGFGFEPTAANLATFTHRNNATTPGPIGGVVGGVADSLVCGGSLASGFSCTASYYVPRAGNDGGANASLPGSYTSSPQGTVVALPDWGCGSQGFTTGGCPDDAPFNEADIVLGNNTPTDGFNTAPGFGTTDGGTTCGIPSGCGPDGTMTGTMVSVVNLNTVAGPDGDGMPSGSITFTRTPNGTVASTGFGGGNCGNSYGTQAGLACNDVTISQVLNQTIAGLYTFAHTDVTSDNFGNPAAINSVSARSYNNVSGAVAGLLGIPNTTIYSHDSIEQAAMGGDAESVGGTDTLAWGTLWNNNEGHPGGAGMFSPGLNVANWAGDNSATLGNTADANGFR